MHLHMLYTCHVTLARRKGNICWCTKLLHTLSISPRLPCMHGFSRKYIRLFFALCMIGGVEGGSSAPKCDVCFKM